MTNHNRPSKALHISLWITQVLLSIVYLMAGITKVSLPITELSKMMPWTGEFPKTLVRFIGSVEILGAAGLILPAILRIRPSLVIVAASGLVLIQILAAIFHVSRGEYSMLGVNFLLFLIALFIAWGRFYKHPILPKA